MSNRIIKAQHVKLTRLREKAPAGFTRGICHIPENKAGVNSRENSRDIDVESEEIRTQVEERVKIALKETYDRGFSEGVTEGMDRKKSELSLAAESVAKLSRELKRLKEEFLESSEKEIIDLVFSIAGKIIHKEVSVDREVVLSVLKDAMKNIQERDGVRIRLNPEDYRYIKEAKPDFLDSFGNMSIEKDEKIGQGGAVIETHFRAVDARLDQQLNKIRDQGLGARDH